MTTQNETLNGRHEAATPPLLSVKNLSVEFITEHGYVTVLDDVSFDVVGGETLGLVGESGSGKTVTSLAVMGLIDQPGGRITNGSVMYEGEDLLQVDERRLRAIRGGEISMIFQEARRSLDPAFTVGDQIAEAVRAHEGLGRKESWKRAVEMLELVEIPNAAKRAREYPHTFSGGMCQRVMMAAALASKPKVLIADEPTTALDVTVQSQVLDLLRNLQHEMGLGILFITHDLGVVAETSDRIAVMYAGQIIEQGKAADIFGAPRHPYTAGLISSLPEIADRKARLSAIPGNVLPPHQWPRGCRFAPRCSYAINDCREGKIELHAGDSGTDTRCIRSGELALTGVR